MCIYYSELKTPTCRLFHFENLQTTERPEIVLPINLFTDLHVKNVDQIQFHFFFHLFPILHVCNAWKHHKALQFFYVSRVSKCNIENILSQLIWPTQYLHVQSQQWKHQNNVWNLSIINNKDKFVVLVSLLLTMIKFHRLFCCFHFWLWTSKYRQTFPK